VADRFFTSRRIGLGALLGVAVSCFAVSFQVPATTRVVVTVAPRVPRQIAPELGVTGHPRHSIDVIPAVGPGTTLAPHLSWKPLVEPTRLEVAAPVLLPDGAALTIKDPWLSLGAQQATEVSLGIRGPGSQPPGSTIALDLHLTDRGAAGAQPDPCQSGEQRLRPRREWPGDDGAPVVARARVETCRGRDSALRVDTSPLAFLVPRADWSQVFVRPREGLGTIPYSNRRAAFALDGATMPFAGLELSYRVEDELDGAPYPRPAALAVTAKVIEAAHLTHVAMPCRDWAGRLGKRCWRELAALPRGPCAAAWPAEVDGKARVLHVTFTGAPAGDCKLLVGVVAQEGNNVGNNVGTNVGNNASNNVGEDMHAMLFDLRSPPRAAPPGRP